METAWLLQFDTEEYSNLLKKKKYQAYRSLRNKNTTNCLLSNWNKFYRAMNVWQEALWTFFKNPSHHSSMQNLFPTRYSSRREDCNFERQCRQETVLVYMEDSKLGEAVLDVIQLENIHENTRWYLIYSSFSNAKLLRERVHLQLVLGEWLDIQCFVRLLTDFNFILDHFKVYFALSN